MLRILLPVAAPLVAIAAVTRYLKGESLTKYDENLPVTFECDPKSDGIKQVNGIPL